MPLNTLFLINALFCGLLASHLITKPVKAEHTAVLGSCYGLMAFLQLAGYLFLSTEMWQIGALRAVVATLLGPLFYYYFHIILSPHRVSFRRVLLHFLPAIFVSLVLFGELESLKKWIDPLLLLSFWGYLGLTIKKLVRSKAELGGIEIGAKVQPMVFQWLTLLIVIIGANALGELLIVWELSSGKLLTESVLAVLLALVFLATNTLTLYCALQRHPLWDWMLESRPNKQRSPKNRGQESEETSSLIQKFTEQLDKNEWFKAESGFTVAMAASALGVSQRQLSEAINAEKGQSYSQLMNKRRVDEAVDMIRQNPKTPLTAVIYDSGFRTKSSFNREFVKIMGKTPSEFQKRIELEV